MRCVGQERVLKVKGVIIQNDRHQRYFFCGLFVVGKHTA